MTEEKVDNNQAGELMHQGLRSVQVNLSSIFEEVQVLKLGQKITTSLPGSPEPVKKKISCKVQSQRGTPVAGSDQIKLLSGSLPCPLWYKGCLPILLPSPCWRDFPREISRCRVKQ